MVPKAPQEGEAGLRNAPAQKGRRSGRGAENVRMRNWRARPRLASRLSPGILASKLLIPGAGDFPKPGTSYFPLVLGQDLYTRCTFIFSVSIA